MNTDNNKKIEPHVILHLRINQDDINRYMKHKIQTDTPCMDFIHVEHTNIKDDISLEQFSNGILNEHDTLSSNNIHQTRISPRPNRNNIFTDVENGETTLYDTPFVDNVHTKHIQPIGNTHLKSDISNLISSNTNTLLYEPDNIDIFTRPFSNNNPTPANLDDAQFETLDVSEFKFNNPKKTDIFQDDMTSFSQQNMILSGDQSSFSLQDTTQNEKSDTLFERNTNNTNNTNDTNDTKINMSDIPENKYFLSIPHVNLDITPDIPQVNPNEDTNCSDVKIKLINAMCEFADANRRNEWIKSTSIWCRWCVHPFSGPPVAIPIRYVNKTFFVTGCYCSYSCAARHLFYRGDINESNRWKYYNLLHLLRKKILSTDETTRIKLAPLQDTLKIFGGHLSVEDFRNSTCETNKHHKIYNILNPPMVSIVPTIEEISYPDDTSDMRLLNTPGGMRAYGNMKYVAPKNESYLSTTRWGKTKPYIPIDEDRMKRAVENLKVKRKTPLLDKKKTLLHYMNLKINKKQKECF